MSQAVNLDAGRSPGTLYVVGTPLGNLEDITLRAQRILGEVDVVAAEDTRRARVLLTHLGITKPIVSYHEHNEHQRARELVSRLQAGESVALVSDAGMPVISDPGQVLVAVAIQAGLTVVPVPGPTAEVTALVLSGLPAERYVFEGFLPRTGSERRRRLVELVREPRTVVLYEAPHRLLRTLVDLEKSVGRRPAAVTRELTKVHEECVRGDLPSLIAHFTTYPPRGECVIVLAGATERGDDCENIGEMLEERLRSYMSKGMSRRDAVRAVVAETGIGRREVYQRALGLGHETID